MIPQGTRAIDLFQLIALGIQNKEVREMLLLEIIGVFGILYCFFTYGTLRALRAKKTERSKTKAEPKAELKPAAAGTVL